MTPALVNAASATPSSPAEVLASFVPRRLRERFAETEGPLTEPALERTEAAVFFADISGFTKLTEELAKHGPGGAEELTTVLNRYFERLIALITGSGGDVMKFAGDGLLALWTGEDLAVLAQRAARCALAIRDELEGYPAAAGVVLSVHSGIGVGEVSLGYVGGERDRWEVLIAGEPLAQMSLAAGHAGAGEVALSPAAWRLVEKAGEARQLDSGDFILLSVEEAPALSPASPTAISPAALAPFVPAAVRGRIGAGQSEWLGELRRVTILFVNLPELGEELPLAEVHEAMCALQRTVYRFEGSVAQLGADDKGVTLLAVLGLPPLMHEDDPWRGVQAARAIREELARLGLHHAIGLTTGRVFCGVVGSALRRQYTVMGDPVNLAARLMQGAHDDVQCDEATARAAGSRVQFETLPPRRMKGKAEPVPVFRPRADVAHAAAGAPMVGRARERARLAGALTRLRDGEGSLWVVEGEAGIGKSCLLRDFAAAAAEHGIRLLGAAGDAIERSTPLLAWRRVFTEFFGLEREEDVAVRERRVRDRLAEDAGLMRLAPLLSAVLPVSLADTEETRPMAGEVRAANLTELLTRLLAGACTAYPTAVVVEDGHWLDSASWALVTALARYVRPVLLLVSTRPLVEPLPECRQFLETAGVQRLVLEPLAAAETAALVCQRLGISELPAELAERIGTRSQGNPFFTEELAAALQAAGVLETHAGVARLVPGVDLQSVVLPESVQSAITGRIDRLRPEEQLTLKVASVIGRSFPLRVLRAIHPVAAGEAELSQELATLERLDLTPREAEAPEPAWLFKHVITQEVAYNLMLFAQRRQLHRAAAQWYEAAHGGNPAPVYPLLAHHWEAAEEWPRAVAACEGAAAHALGSGVYEEAVTFLEKAVELAARLPAGECDALREARWHRQLGEALIGLGRLPEAKAQTEQALRLYQVRVRRTPWELARGYVEEAARQVWHRLRPARLTAAPETLREIARSHEAMAQISYYAGDVLTGVYWALAGLNVADRVNPCRELAQASATISYALSVAMLPGPGQWYVEQAYAVLERLGDPHARIWVLELTGMYASNGADWAAATERLKAAVALTATLGDWRRWEESIMQLSALTFYRGQPMVAHSLALQMRERALRSGRVQAQILAGCLVTMTGLRLGLVNEARETMAQTPPLLVHGLSLVEQLWWTGNEVTLALAEGCAEEARERAVHAQGLMARMQAMSNLHFETYAGVVDLFLRRLEAGSRAADDRRRARRALWGLRFYARTFRFAQPRALALRGRAAALRGRHGKAERLWREGVRAAVAMELPWEAGELHRLLSGRPAGEAEAAA